jgi:hypothetical protein
MVITIAGAQLLSVQWITVSPFSHPWRTLIFSFPIIIFSYMSLNFLRRVSLGSTIIICSSHFPIFLKVVAGKIKLTTSQKKQGCQGSYCSPITSAFLGLLLFASAEILMIMLFMQPVYYFQIP